MTPRFKGSSSFGRRGSLKALGGVGSVDLKSTSVQPNPERKSDRCAPKPKRLARTSPQSLSTRNFTKFINGFSPVNSSFCTETGSRLDTKTAEHKVLAT